MNDKYIRLSSAINKPAENEDSLGFYGVKNKYGNIEFIASSDEYQTIQSILRKSISTDIVEFADLSEFANFGTYWCGEEIKEDRIIPADIIKSNTIPIEDVKIKWEISADDNSFDNTEFAVSPDSKGKYTLRIIYVGNLIESDMKLLAYLTVEVYHSKFELVVPIVYKYSDKLSTYSLFMASQFTHPTMKRDAFNKILKFNNNLLTMLKLCDVVYIGLRCWYGIQIALTHPIVKDIFKKPYTEKRDRKELLSYTGKKGKSKYIKRHVITEDNNINTIIDKKLDEINKTHADGKNRNKRKYTRTMLLWRVIGHYRKKKSGDEKIWINPYWKGIMRDFPSINTLEENVREVILKENIFEELSGEES